MRKSEIVQCGCEDHDCYVVGKDVIQSSRRNLGVLFFETSKLEECARNRMLDGHKVRITFETKLSNP
jgi:hypothetical protein